MKKINLVLQSSGIIGICYIGALKYLYENEFVCNKIVGVSSGAIVGALLAAGYTPEQLEVIIINTDFGKLVGDLNLTLDEKIQLLLSQGGVYTWDNLEAWLNELLEAKGIYTFDDMKLKGVVKSYKLITADITRENVVILPEDLNQYNINPSSYPVAKAVRMSATIPYFFTPAILPFNNENDYMADGGILYSYPINFFDKDYNDKYNMIPTIGIKVSSVFMLRSNSYSLEILNYTAELLSTISKNNYILGNTTESIERSIVIPTFGISPLAFDLTKEQKMSLIQSGYDSAKVFMEDNCNKYEVKDNG